MNTLYTCWDNVLPPRTESLHFFGLMNPATSCGLHRFALFGLWVFAVFPAEEGFTTALMGFYDEFSEFYRGLGLNPKP